MNPTRGLANSELLREYLAIRIGAGCHVLVDPMTLGRQTRSPTARKRCPVAVAAFRRRFPARRISRRLLENEDELVSPIDTKDCRVTQGTEVVILVAAVPDDQVVEYEPGSLHPLRQVAV